MKDIIAPLIIALLALFQIYPVLRMLNAWLVDKTISGRLAFFALSVHGIAIAALWHAGEMTYLLVYLSVTSLIWLFSPIITRLGDAASLRKLRDDDLKRYQALLGIDPRNAAAHAAIADIYLERGRLDDAIEAYQRAIEAAPEHTRREQWLLQRALEMRERRWDRRRVPLPPVETLADSMTAPLPLRDVPPAEEPPEQPAEPTEPAGEERPAETWHWYDNLDDNTG